jgi:hypothetical protein
VFDERNFRSHREITIRCPGSLTSERSGNENPADQVLLALWWGCVCCCPDSAGLLSLFAPAVILLRGLCCLDPWQYAKGC